MLYAFAVFAALMMTLATTSFHISVKKHAEVKVVVPEDPAIKAKGINLPGYNH